MTLSVGLSSIRVARNKGTDYLQAIPVGDSELEVTASVSVPEELYHQYGQAPSPKASFFSFFLLCVVSYGFKCSSRNQVLYSNGASVWHIKTHDAGLLLV